MHNTPIPYEASGECLDKLKLNAVIASMDTLEKTGVVTDREEAHEQALLLDPHMTKVIGHLALAVQRHKNYHRDIYGLHRVPNFAYLHLIRQNYSVRQAKREIAAGYEALADPTE